MANLLIYLFIATTYTLAAVAARPALSWASVAWQWNLAFFTQYRGRGVSPNFACRSFSEARPIIGCTAHGFAPIRALGYLPWWNS